jgi:hypothetical protein
MKQITLFLFTFLCFMSVRAQRVDWMDFGTTGGFSTDNNVATDAAGYIYSFHTFIGNVILQGDTINAQYGQTDCLLLKYNSSGSLIWYKVFGGGWFDDANKVATDASGHVYVTAHVQTNTFMSDTSFANTTDYLVYQFDSSGNFLRAKFIPGLGTTALAALGDYIYIGHSSTVQKLDTNLATIWSRSELSNAFTFYSTGDLYVTPGGRLIASGAEQGGGTAVFDTISFNFTAGGFDEVFVISMDTSGTAFWGRALYGGGPTETTFGAAGDEAGNVYLTLRAQAQMIFGNDTLVNPTGNPNNNYNAVVRFDNSGNEIWGRALYPGGSADFFDVLVNDSAQVLVSGNFLNGASFFEQFNFDALPGAAFIIKVDSSGNALWVKHDKYNAQTKHFKGLARLSPGRYVSAGFFNTNFLIDCFYGGFSTYGFFTTVISENIPVDAAFTYQVVDPFTFNFTDQSTVATSWLWNFGDSSTSNLQNPSHTFATAGNYTITLVVSDGICTDTAQVLIINVGINEIHAALDIVLYPNPAGSEMTVQSTKQIDEIRITDVLGRELWRQAEINAMRFKLPTANLTTGIYFLAITADGISASRKFSKE